MARSSKKKKKKYIYIVPVILWMTFIFYMSAKTGEGSSAVSNPITDLIVDIFQRVRHDTAPAVDRRGRGDGQKRCPYDRVWNSYGVACSCGEENLRKDICRMDICVVCGYNICLCVFR